MHFSSSNSGQGCQATSADTEGKECPPETMISLAGSDGRSASMAAYAVLLTDHDKHSVLGASATA